MSRQRTSDVFATSKYLKQSFHEAASQVLTAYPWDWLVVKVCREIPCTVAKV